MKRVFAAIMLSAVLAVGTSAYAEDETTQLYHSESLVLRDETKMSLDELTKERDFCVEQLLSGSLSDAWEDYYFNRHQKDCNQIRRLMNERLTQDVVLSTGPIEEIKKTCDDLQQEVDERNRKARRRARITRYVLGAVCFPLYLGIGIAYAPIVGPIAMMNVWDETFIKEETK